MVKTAKYVQHMLLTLIVFVTAFHAAALTVETSVHGHLRVAQGSTNFGSSRILVSKNPALELVGAMEFALTPLDGPVDVVTLDINVTFNQFDLPVSIDLRGYAGNGVVAADDATAGSVLTTIALDTQNNITVDVTQFVNDLIAQGATWAGFSLMLVDDILSDVAEFGSPETPAYPELLIAGGPVSFEVNRLVPVPPVSGGYFGRAAAMGGSVVAIGADLEDGNSTGNEGAVYVFVGETGSGLSQVQKLRASDGRNNLRFGTSVAVHDDIIVTSSDILSTPQLNSALYVFLRDAPGANSWTEITQLKSDGLFRNDRYGESVAVSGDIVITGARWDLGPDGVGDSVGAVYVYERDRGGANAWGLVKKLAASNTQASVSFGQAVALSGDTLAVGEGSGAVHVFMRNSGGGDNWGEVEIITPGDMSTGQNFGSTVAISGDTLLVGAAFDDEAFENAGSVYVFERNVSGVWIETDKLLPDLSVHPDRPGFGMSVAFSGDRIVVGAPLDSVFGEDEGSAYVFARNESAPESWERIGYFTGSEATTDDQFGQAVAMSGSTVLVGAVDVAAGYTGAVYVFEFDNGNLSCEPHILALDFGGKDVGTSHFYTIALTNSGGAPCTFSAIDLQGPADFTLLAPALPLTLPPDISTTLKVGFTPATPGNFAATLSVASVAPLQPLIVDIAGTGVPRCDIQLSTDSLVFGDVDLGANVAQTLIIGNTGLVDCLVDLTLSGDQSFSIASGTPDPVVVAPGELTLVGIEFSADVISFHNASLAVHSNDPDESQLSVAISAFVPTAGCDLLLDSVALDFGDVFLGTSATLTLGLENFGMGECNTVLSLSDEINFTFGSGTPVPGVIAPGESVSLPFVFTTTVIATFNETLTVVSDDAFMPIQTVLLTAFTGNPDNDSVDNSIDNCMTFDNDSQLDTDSDGFGNRCDADLNNDCIVNALDLGLFRTLFHQPNNISDFNGDGITSVVDLGIFRTLFFYPPGPSALVPVCVPQ